MAKLIKQTREMLDRALTAGLSNMDLYLQETLADNARKSMEIVRKSEDSFNKELSKWTKYCHEGEEPLDAAIRIAEKQQRIIDLFCKQYD